MTREEAREFLLSISYSLGNMSVEYLSEKDGKKMREAMQALEQDTVSKESYDHEYFLRKEFEVKIHEQESILDKIRAEIEASRWTDKDIRIERNALASGLEVAMEIIDKYKAESEVSNADCD